MFKSFIKDCFGSLKEANVEEAKRKFGLIWSAFASKVIRLKEEEIKLSWREISAQLAEVFNEWHDVSFTTDAFLKVHDHRTPLGAYPEYDEILNAIANQDNCVGIFVVNQPQLVSGSMEIGVSETNFMTGEIIYFKQKWENGKPVGKTEISAEDYETICYGA